MTAQGEPLVIAIDGPAASGKSTLGAALAARLGFTYFDSGVVYRALTWLALDRGIDVTDGAALAEAAGNMRITVERPASTVADGRQATVLVESDDVTWKIRAPEVDRSVSTVSAHPAVRDALTARLRSLAAGGGMVMVGRDIGTVVLPQARVKVYLTASAEERARRRCRDLEARGVTADYTSILADLRRRDEIDGTRAAAPMRPAPDAHMLDSDGVSVDDLVERVQRLAREQPAGARP